VSKSGPSSCLVTVAAITDVDEVVVREISYLVLHHRSCLDDDHRRNRRAVRTYALYQGDKLTIVGV
jgi:hypothetical protein